MNDNALNHADVMAGYDPWTDNDAAHTALLESIKNLSERIKELEQTLKAVKILSEDNYRQIHPNDVE
jgi:hypothetical protein